MDNEKMTLGAAIDAVIAALDPLEQSARETAVLAACRQLKITTSVVSAAPPLVSPDQPKGNVPTSPAAKLPSPRMDIRTLKEKKQPRSARDMACLVAYYLKDAAGDDERKETISATDLEKYFKQAGYKLPTRMAQVLVDAKSAGYFESVGRGEYKLNAVGYNLVAHNLPVAK